MKRLVIGIAAALVAAGAEALEISKVQEGKLCALSFTYDDGVETHYTHALPLHLKYGIPGTFLIVTDEVWLRVAPSEKVSVNGKPATPNKYGAILARVGDTVVVP